MPSCGYVCLYVCTHESMHEEARGHPQCHSSEGFHLSLWDRLCRWPRAGWACLAGWPVSPTSGIYLCLPPQCWDYKQVPPHLVFLPKFQGSTSYCTCTISILLTILPAPYHFPNKRAGTAWRKRSHVHPSHTRRSDRSLTLIIKCVYNIHASTWKLNHKATRLSTNSHQQPI